MLPLSNCNKIVSFVVSLVEIFTVHFYCVFMYQVAMAVLLQFID